MQQASAVFLSQKLKMVLGGVCDPTCSRRNQNDYAQQCCRQHHVHRDFSRPFNICHTSSEYLSNQIYKFLKRVYLFISLIHDLCRTHNLLNQISQININNKLDKVS